MTSDAQRKEYYRQWAAKNRDKLRAAQVKFKALHPERMRAYRAAYKKTHPDVDRKWQAANKDKVRAYRQKYIGLNAIKYKEDKRRWALENKDKVRQSCANYRAKYPERVREIHARSLLKNPRGKWWIEFYKKNKSKVCARNKAWMDKNKERMRPTLKAKHAKRRALKAAATINLRSIKRWIRSVDSRSKNTCYYCQFEIPKGQHHFDHIIALSKGGPHSVENLCVSCAKCNLTKSDKSIVAWAKVGQQFLSL